MLLRSLAALLQFCTVIPSGKIQDFEHLARRSYLFPLAGYVLGGIAALLVYLIRSRPLAAAVALAVVLLLSGLNHLDGLFDVGDALMVHGPREKRIAALTDPYVGAGGIGLGLCITLVSLAALQGAPEIWIAILAAEVFAKLSISYLTAYGRPFHEGIHSRLHASARPYFPFIAGILTLPLLLLLHPVLWAGSMVLSITTASCMLLFARRFFGGVNGDVVGASHEIVRAAVLAGMVLIVSWL
jgi:adenosylcobinamide-GDP ribazoletransferase